MTYRFDTISAGNILSMYECGQCPQFADLDSVEKSNAFVDAMKAGKPIMVITEVTQDREAGTWIFGNVAEIAGLISYMKEGKRSTDDHYTDIPVVRF